MLTTSRLGLLRGSSRLISTSDISSNWHYYPRRFSATRTNREQSRRTLLTLSEVAGSLHPPLLAHTLPEYFSTEILPQYADRPALICKQEKADAYSSVASTNSGELRWTYEEMDKHVEALSNGMIAMGVERGDRVGVVLGNSSAYALLQWACARIGAVIVTINPAYRMHELIATLNLAGVSRLFISPTLRSTHYTTLLNASLPTLASASQHDISDAACPSLKSIILVNNQPTQELFEKELNGLKPAIDFRELFIRRGANEDLKKREQSLHRDDVINLQFTSGTTGLPKAVSLSHHNLLNNGYYIGSCMPLTETDKLCLVLGNLAAWTHRACIVYASESYDPRAILHAVESERCTALHGVPSHYLGVMAVMDQDRKRGKEWDLTSLRTGIAAGTTIPIDLMQKLIKELNLVDLSIAYGMTETSPVSFQTVHSDPLVKRVETVGKVQPHVRAKIVDEQGKVVPVGQPGELCVSGYLVQRGYWNDPEQTASVMKQHEDDPDTMWMHTGDQGILDEEGYLSIVGRIKDIIIRGGENLFPVQIENLVTSHPSIREAAVISVPNPLYGEVVGVWLTRNEGQETISREDVRKLVREGMNPQNAPDWVWFVGEDGVQSDLPKTASGKIMKNVLRDWSRDWSAKGVGAVGRKQA